MSHFDARTLLERQAKLAATFAADGRAVLVAAGEPLPKPGGLDQTYPFQPHPEYYWLTGITRPGGIMAYSPGEDWTHFVVPVSDTERLWIADTPTPPGEPIDSFRQWLASHRERGVVSLGCRLPEGDVDPTVQRVYQQQFDALRRRKDAAEIALFREACAATAAGYARLEQVIRPGTTERAIQIELEAETSRHGATGMGYETIIAAGRRAAVLHCHPGPTPVGEQDVVLVDAGGEIDFYTADVTRTFPAGGKFTAEQQAIYDIILRAELAGIGCCRVGVEWHDVHRTAAMELATGLRNLGIITCSVDEALSTAAIWLFFPHGIGHTVGLGVRDVGGHAPDREPGRTCCGATPRIDFPLEAGHLVTVEPGIYFVPAILDNPHYRAQHAAAVNWDALDQWRAVGGIRIEDNVLITDGDPDVLTSAIPK